MLDIRRLQALQAVARHGSIAAAAQALHFTAPAISQQLAALERETEASLFFRTARSIELTDAGMLLAAHADIVLAQLEAASAALAAEQAPSGLLTAAAFPTALATIVADALTSMRASHPGVNVSVVEAEPDEAERMLGMGRVDVAVVHHYDLVPRVVPNSVSSTPLFDEEMILVAPSAEPIRGRRSNGRTAIDVHELRNEHWVVPRLGSSCHELVQRVCGAAGFVPTIAGQCNDYRSTIAMVRAGCGVALVPQLAIDGVALEGVVTRRLSTSVRRYVSVQTSSRSPTRLTALVLESLRAASGSRAQRTAPKRR